MKPLDDAVVRGHRTILEETTQRRLVFQEVYPFDEHRRDGRWDLR